jgi:NitT/TauT family transport system substrate-binding protein
MKTLRLETTAPFQGLAELVAYDEGLFEKEGIQIEWLDREKGLDKSPQMHITDHKDASRFVSHGRMMESGQADLYNACEWGNFSRVETTNVGSRQVGRRSMVNFAGIVVRADSPVQTPQQFATVQIGVPMYSGTHYLCLQMLEGFVPRELIMIGGVPNGSN